MSLKENALKYAQAQGFDMTKASLVIGQLPDGRLATMSLRHGSERWSADRNFERDGGIFLSETQAQADLETAIAWDATDHLKLVGARVCRIIDMVEERYKIAVVIEREILDQDGNFFKPPGDEGNSWSLIATVPNIKPAVQLVTYLHKAAEKVVRYNAETGYDQLGT
jgi:hypothetical protein